jgi:hypothetical protein
VVSKSPKAKKKGEIGQDVIIDYQVLKLMNSAFEPLRVGLSGKSPGSEGAHLRILPLNGFMRYIF